MSRSNENWLLVEWMGGGSGVVYIKSVLSPVNKELKIGDLITVNWRGEPKPATLVARAKDRSQLESIRAEEKAPPSPKADEEQDYSASGSSWAPSDDDSGDSDKETSKKIKLDVENMNRRSSKKILTPSHRANAVIPTKMLQDTNSKKNTLDRKRTYNTISRNGSFNKSLPDSTKVNNSKSRKETKRLDLVQQLEDIKNHFGKVMKMFENYKRQCQIGFVGDRNLVVPFNENGNNTVNQTEYDCDENQDQEYENDEEFNRSDDNVLITNKYESQFTDASSASPKERVMPFTNKELDKDEWIPIGSGKTMIHKDQFEKVNWKSYTIATRTLLLAIFPRRILATHSLTGKRSPAFQNKPAKMCLDPKIISDVIMEITDRFNIKENLVRSIITTKCADECKMLKQRKNKKSSAKNDEETVSPIPNN